MNKNLLLLNFLRSLREKIQPNITEPLSEELDRLYIAYKESSNFIKINFLNENQTVNTFKSREELIGAITNNISTSYQSNLADAIIEQNIVSIESNVDVIISFQEKFSVVKEKLDREYIEITNSLGFNLVDLLEEIDETEFDKSKINKNTILENFNKNNSFLALLNDIIFYLEINQKPIFN
jgi:hypothetical protein